MRQSKKKKKKPHPNVKWGLTRDPFISLREKESVTTTPRTEP